ncbi:short-chain dehydrogenase/reductase family 16C member 6-like [Stegodyphus dumicola]|uniref:short-chain dehydrogenase/reductase family 16C member 6-like n=1 Tax=Stegodyphus dumicola TaxID=202533 RepID=UPI0015B1F244|nr:short-chain dehydrogenase/reductase family 16C member 6-like [Stegodyphus dumicola]XP_035226487.1 short-chain dehydrogenase/reductase family 16C member 6-like [Stegodyphus dumicola]
MNEVVETVVNILVVFYCCLEGIVLFFIPRRFKYKDITNEIVLITGAGSGIGRLMAIKFAKKGVILVLWDINVDGNEGTAKLVREEGGKAYTYKVDVTDREAVYKTAAKVKEDVGIVTILVNNAGIVSGKKILDLDDKMIEKVFSVNALSHFWITKAFLPDMIKKNHGHLVSIASLAGLGGMPQLTDYCASKFAAVGLMESLYVELHAEGYSNIHTTTVCPFFINTGMFNGAKAKMFQMLEPDYVAEEILAAVLCNQQIILIPRIFYILNVVKTLVPSKALLALHDACGGSMSMKAFTGRNMKSKEQ